MSRLARVTALLLAATFCFSFFCAVATHNTIHSPVFTTRGANRVFQAVLTTTYGAATEQRFEALDFRVASAHQIGWTRELWAHDTTRLASQVATESTGDIASLCRGRAGF